MSRRTERINNLIRQEISELLQREMRDPRLAGLVTITRVTTSPDLHHAKVYVSVIGTKKNELEVIQALTSASGFLRKELGRRVRIKTVPELAFAYDEVVAQASHVLQLIEEVSTETGEEDPSER